MWGTRHKKVPTNFCYSKLGQLLPLGFGDPSPKSLMTRKTNRGPFWGYWDILFLSLGAGYRACSVCKNAFSCELMRCVCVFSNNVIYKQPRELFRNTQLKKVGPETMARNIIHRWLFLPEGKCPMFYVYVLQLGLWRNVKGTWGTGKSHGFDDWLPSTQTSLRSAGALRLWARFSPELLKLGERGVEKLGDI